MAKQPSYQELNEELQSILNELQREDIDVEVALKQYERGLEITKQLEDYLKTAENNIKAVQAKFTN